MTRLAVLDADKCKVKNVTISVTFVQWFAVDRSYQSRGDKAIILKHCVVDVVPALKMPFQSYFYRQPT